MILLQISGYLLSVHLGCQKPGLEFQLDTAKFIISYYHLPMSIKHQARATVYIVPHEGCWRPGFAWLYDKYPEYFNPISQRVVQGEGWFMMVDPLWDETSMADLKKRGVTWVEFHSHFPFLGLYAPLDRDSWMIIIDKDNVSYERWKDNSIFLSYIYRTGYEANRVRIARLDSLDIQTYLYFQSFESWKQYAKKYFPNDIAIGANNDTLPAWQSCYLMNPDPKHPWGKYIISQLNKLLDKYPKADGIFYDRDDYCDYDYAHDNGVTMIGNKPAYMLGFAQEKINDLIVNKVHERRKAIWTNGSTSVEVSKGMDGIMSENLLQAPYLQYLGINRPLILLPYDTTPQQTEDKLKTALWTGHFPGITWGGDSCKDIDKRYQSLFSLFKHKHWVLYPRALQLPDGIKGNIFQTPDSDYLVSLVDLEKFSIKSDPFRFNLWAKVRVPDFQEIKYCYFLSGDYQRVNRETVFINPSQADIEINVPVQRAAPLILLTKKPRYEITRTSSPVLTRGESDKLEIRIQNIVDKTKKYDIQLITPFGMKAVNFSLEPKQSRKVELDFKIPNDFALGETTTKVIVQSVKKDTVVFTSWVVDLVQFQLPENIFIHFPEGEDIPFSLVNNTERTLKVKLTGNFKEGRGKVKLPAQNLILKPLEAKELVVNIVADSEVGYVQLIADVENRRVEVFGPVERAMKLESSDYFQDDFSLGNMNKWDTTFGIWKVENAVARGSGSWHLAIKNGNWGNFKYQVNTKLVGSTDPSVDWLKSYLFFRFQNDSNYYRFGIQGSDEISLYKRENWKWKFLGKDQSNLKKNVWYNLRVEVKGDSIKGFLDGKQVLSFQDTTFKSGGVGIGVLEDNMINYYDDVIVSPVRQ